VTLDLVSDLPGGTQISMVLGAGVRVNGEPLNALGETVTVSFTKGVDVDTTPPTTVSLSPASGTTSMSASINWLGFADVPDDGAPAEITFGTPVKFLPMSIAIGTWTAATRRSRCPVRAPTRP
jgi:hypothetical protein